MRLGDASTSLSTLCCDTDSMALSDLRPRFGLRSLPLETQKRTTLPIGLDGRNWDKAGR